MSPVRRTCVPPHSSIDQAGLVAVRLAHRHDAHLVAVFLAEQRHRAVFHRRLRRHQPRGDLGVLADAGVHLGLDPVQFIGGYRPRLGDVEAQPIGGVQAALLLHMGAELAPQRLMQQMRGGVMRADRATPRVIDRGDDGDAGRRDAGLDAAEMHEQVAQLLLRIGDRDHQTIGTGDHAGIADLAAAFAVERGLVQHDGDIGAGRGRFGRGAVRRRRPGFRPRRFPSRSRGTPTAPAFSLISNHTFSVAASPDPAQAARARVRCSCIAASNPARSTVRPCSRSASCVRSSGKP